MRRVLSISAAGLLAGCVVGPRYREPKILVDPTAAPGLAASNEAAFTGSTPPPVWWRLYDDPVLDALINKALINNTDLRGALASLEQAHAELSAVRGQRLPETSLSGVGTYGASSMKTAGLSLTSDPITLYDVTETVSYDLDLFGKLRRAVQAAKANVEEAEAALDLARVNVVASTASSYAQACSAGSELAITDQSIAVAQETLDVTEARYRAGAAPITDVVKARGQVDQTRSQRPSLVAEQRSSLFTLATLTGDLPENVPTAVMACAKPPILRQPIPVGDGAALLARRPDVREAERKLASAVAEIGVSTAALYPSIELGGSVGETKTRVGTISARVFSWNVGSLINWTFPNFSAARAQIASSKAMAKSALANFDGKVLTGLRETETALTKLARDLDAQSDLAASRAEAAAAYADTLNKYRGGVGQFYEVLDAEKSLIQADNSLASASASVSQDQLTLFMALGGGWELAPPVKDTSLKGVEAAG